MALRQGQIQNFVFSTKAALDAASLSADEVAFVSGDNAFYNGSGNKLSGRFTAADTAARTTIEAGLGVSDIGTIIYQQDSEAYYLWNGSSSDISTSSPLVASSGAPFDYFQPLSSGDRQGSLTPVADGSNEMIDGVVETGSGPTNIGTGLKTLGFDFGSAIEVGQMTYSYGNAGGGNYTNEQPVYSDDAVSWFSAGPAFDAINSGGTTVIPISETGSHQYWGVQIQSSNGNRPSELDFQLRQANTPAYGSDLTGPVLAGNVRLSDVSVDAAEDTLLVLQPDNTVATRELDLASLIPGGGSSNYIQLGTAIIQWGSEATTVDTEVTVTLPVAFANANYALTFAFQTDGTISSSSVGAIARFANKTTTTFGIDRDDDMTGTQTVDWIAIGQAP